MNKKNFVCLIQPHTSFKLMNVQPALFDQFDSIGLMSLSAYLKEKGYEVEILHLAKAFRNGYSLQQVIDKIKSREPILFGIGNMWVHQSVGMLETATLLKEIYPNIPIIVGGQHASFFSRDIVESYSGLIDGVIVGEGEETLYDVVKSVEESGIIEKSIPGLMVKNSNGEIEYTRRDIKLELDNLPFLSHKGIWPKIDPLPGDIIPYAAALDTVRGGCPQSCVHCLEGNGLGKLGRNKRAFHSPEYLIDQMKLYLQEGKTNILIQDSFYANGNKPIEKFVDLAKQENLFVDAMHFFVEPGYLSSDIFKVLESFPAQKVAVDYGIETGSEKVARNMGRYYNLDKIYRDVEILGKTKTVSTAWWLISLPGETEEDFLETVDVVKKVRYDSAFTFIYSKRTGTPAAVMENQVPEDVVKDRFNRLLETVQTIGREMSARDTGKVMEVLVEEQNSQDKHLMTGRLSNNLLVHFEGDTSLIGQLCQVRLDECRGFYYMGTKVG